MTPERAEEMREHNQECRQAVLDELYDYYFQLLKAPAKTESVVAVAKVLLDEYREENTWAW